MNGSQANTRMSLNTFLYEHFKRAAAAAIIDCVSIGLGYTAVTTDAGGIGVAYSYFKSKRSCQFLPDFQDCEGRSGLTLLEGIRSEEPLHRSVALAAINALNHRAAIQLTEDSHNIALFDVKSAKLVRCYLFRAEGVEFEFRESGNPYVVVE